MRQGVFACLEEGPADWFIGCAAVADYRPATPQSGKMKKTSAVINCRLIRTRDIVAEVAACGQVGMTVGFAAETSRLMENALAKLHKKKLDVVIANQVGHQADYGFDKDDNKVEVCWRQGAQSLGPMPKAQLAGELISLLYELYKDKINDGKNGEAFKSKCLIPGYAGIFPCRKGPLRVQPALIYALVLMKLWF